MSNHTILHTVQNPLNIDIASFVSQRDVDVQLDAEPNYMVAGSLLALAELKESLMNTQVSFVMLEVTNNKCRTAFFANARTNRTALFSAEIRPMAGAKPFVPNYWLNWMNES